MLYPIELWVRMLFSSAITSANTDCEWLYGNYCQQPPAACRSAVIMPEKWAGRKQGGQERRGFRSWKIAAFSQFDTKNPGKTALFDCDIAGPCCVHPFR